MNFDKKKLSEYSHYITVVKSLILNDLYCLVSIVIYSICYNIALLYIIITYKHQYAIDDYRIY